VCSAGNYSADLDKILIYPCSYDLDNIINVMAIDNTGKIYSSSGYGSNTVDIAAPGNLVKVIIPEDDVVYIDGTSVATAFVTSTAALMLSEDSSLSPYEIKNIINSSAQKVDSLSSLCVAGGYLDVCSALRNI